jgi:hypothetical protein
MEVRVGRHPGAEVIPSADHILLVSIGLSCAYFTFVQSTRYIRNRDNPESGRIAAVRISGRGS